MGAALTPYSLSYEEKGRWASGVAVGEHTRVCLCLCLCLPSPNRGEGCSPQPFAGHLWPRMS
jgi:hypothetical protein